LCPFLEKKNSGASVIFIASLNVKSEQPMANYIIQSKKWVVAPVLTRLGYEFNCIMQLARMDLFINTSSSAGFFFFAVYLL
jgi:hypothetical protein